MSKLSFLSKAIRFPLRLIPKNHVVTFQYGPMKGLKWIIGASNHGYWLGSYERRMKDIVCQVLPKSGTFLDLGGHVGYYSLLASKVVGPSGRIFTFEPLPRNLHFLYKHIAINKLTNIKVYEGAVGCFDGVARFDDRSPVGAKLSANGRIDVRVFALMRLLKENAINRPDGIKIDIEGAELNLLEDISDYLKEQRIPIFLSTHGKEIHKNCIKLLSELGYDIEPLDGPSLNACTEIFCNKPYRPD